MRSLKAVAAVLLFLSMGLLGHPASVAQVSPLRTWQTWLRVGVTTEGNTFDPHVNVTQPSGQRMFPIYEGLVENDVDGRVRPLLAESWEISADGKRYTFKLRRDVKFSDGTPFDAAAVKFNFDRLLALKRGPISLFEPVTAVRVLDPSTVQIELREAFAPFLSILAGWQARFFISPKAVRDHAEPGDEWATKWLHTNTAGTGAYQLESWQPEDRVVLVRNPNYRGRWTDAHITRVTYQLLRESATAAQFLMRGDIDFLERVPIDFIPIFQRVSRIRTEVVTTHGGANGLHIYINHRKPPFENVKVRQAMAYAIDYDRIIKDGYAGFASKARSPLPQTLNPWFNSRTTVYSRNLDRARQLMREANVSTPVRVRLVWRSDFSEERTLAQIIKENLLPLGFDVQIEEQTLPVVRETIWSGNSELLFFTHSMRYIDPDSILHLFFHSSNIRRGGFNVGYKSEEVDRLLESARSQVRVEDRIRTYNRIQEVMTADAAHLFLVDLKDTYAMRDYVSGYVFNPNRGVQLDVYRMGKDPAGYTR